MGPTMFCNVDVRMALQNRGFIIKGGDMAPGDMARGLEKAFSTDDAVLLNLLLSGLIMSEFADQHGELLNQLFHDHPGSSFKNSAAASVAAIICRAPRLAQSKLGCECYSIAASAWFSASTSSSDWSDSRMCLQSLAEYCGLDLSAYACKKLLVTPPTQESLHVAVGCLEINAKDFAKITPEAAYHIYQRYKGTDVFKEYEVSYKGKVKELLASTTMPENATLTAVMSKLDASIVENGRRLCEKYGTLTPKPYEAPVEVHIVE